MNMWEDFIRFDKESGKLYAWLAGDHGSLSDSEFIEAHEFVMPKFGDADFCGKSSLVHDRDIRSDLSIGEMQQLEEEYRLRKQRNRN